MGIWILEVMLKMDSSKFSNNEVMVHVTDDNNAPSLSSYMEFTKIHIFFTFLKHNGKHMYHNL
jgi:hypothetical protein